jgi:hypothetical protein
LDEAAALEEHIGENKQQRQNRNRSEDTGEDV